MIEDQVIRNFRAAHPQGAKCIIRRWDRDAIAPASHALVQLPDQQGFFKRALASLPADRQTLEAAIGCLNNPAIVNGSTLVNGKRSAWDYCQDLEKNSHAT